MGRAAWRPGWRRAKDCEEVALGTQGGVRSCRVIERGGRGLLDRERDGRAAGEARTIELPAWARWMGRW